jgi:hypothetical protein
MRRAWHLLPITAIVVMFGLTVPPVSVRGADSITVKVSVDASESAGNPLTYRWRATDGQIVDQDSPTTDWKLPNGPGIHFAYVLVSNGKGGYTEGRIAVNTDGNPTTTVVPRDNKYPQAASKIFNMSGKGFFQPVSAEPDLLLPLDNGQGTIKGVLLLGGFGDTSVCGKRIPFFGVDATAIVQLRDKDDKPLSETVLNPYAFGEFSLADVNGGTKLFAICEGATQQFITFDRGDVQFPNPLPFLIKGTTQPEVKSMSAIQDGKPVGIFPVLPTPARGTLPSDFFGRRDHNVSGTPRFLSFKGLDTRKGGCEYYKAIGAVAGCDPAGNFVGAVLNFKDWRKSVRIGEFRQTTGFSPREPTAAFINETDLNLTRDHHSIAYGADSKGREQLVAYVCNHPGAAADPNVDPTGLFPAQSSIDTAIDNVLPPKVDAAHPQGRNLVACVAMDRSSDIVDVNGNKTTDHVGDPFTRFLIFGPNGDLLPSVNLDGNGEKFVPGTCVACHGGNNYFALANDTPPDNQGQINPPLPSTPIFGGFPETGAGGPNLKSYFLPYDVGNFLFSSKHPNTINDVQMQVAIFELNENAWLVDRDISYINFKHTIPNASSDAFDDLFHRWYHGDIVFDLNALPPSSPRGGGDPPYLADTDKFYRNVVARSCRSCHVAMDDANFETKDPVRTTVIQNLVCGQATHKFPSGDPTASSYLMPNSQVTFDRFWLSDPISRGRPDIPGQPNGIFNQPDALRKHHGSLSVSDCRNPI